MPPANLSPGLQEIVKLARAGMSDDVILAYIKNSGASYKMSADDILYLKDQGVSQNAILALLRAKATDNENSAGAPAPPPASTEPSSEPVSPAAALPVAPPPPVPVQTEFGNAPRNTEHGGTGGCLRIVSGDGDFSSIASEKTKVVKASAGATLSGTVRLRALNLANSDAVAPLIYTVSWGDHRTGWRQINGWVRSGESDQEAKLSVTVPSSPGIYHIIFAFAWEIGADHVASGSNWGGWGARAKPARWDDGHDIAGLGASQLEEAQDKGYALVTWLDGDGYTRSKIYVPVDAISLIVGGNLQTASAPAPVSVQTLNRGLVAYYPFDGNANDASGNGHDATLMNSPSFVNGVKGPAVYLRGSGEFGTDGQYVQLPAMRLADYPAFTISVWAKLDGVTAGDWASLISLGTETCGPPNTGRPHIDYCGDCSPSKQLSFGAGGPGTVVPMPNDCWQNWAHYALVCDDGVLTGFVNGRVVATRTGVTVAQTGTDGGLGITRWNTAGCPYGVSTRFVGAVSDLRIYNRALSSDEITQLAQRKTATNVGDQAPPGNLSPGLERIVQLSKAQFGEEVVVAYIKKSGVSYTVSADDLLYLKSQGVSQNVIAALFQTKSDSVLTPVIDDAQGSIGHTSLTLQSGSQLYVFALATGGALPSSQFTAGQSIQVQDAGPKVTAIELAATKTNSDSFRTSTMYHTVVGFGASGFEFAQGFYAANPDAGAHSASVQFTLTAPALVVLVGAASGQQYLVFSGLPDLVTNVPYNTVAATAIAHASLGPGTYTAQMTSSDTAALQDPNNMADLLGVLIFSDYPSAATSTNAQIPLPGSGNAGVSVISPPSASAPPPTVIPREVNMDYFQDQLSPYGSWVDVPGYGLCWQPSDIPPGWRPYYDNGHWVYTDAGLYWQSDYPWGPIPFHYGRWAWVDGYGWIWAPSYDYAPAWVFWRHADGYLGWAPLPCGAVWVAGGWWYHGVRVAADYDFGLGTSFFIFVSNDHLWERDYRRFALHGEELHRVYQVSAVNRFHRDEHGRFVQEGLDREHLERLTGRKVEEVRLEELRNHDFGVARNDHDRVLRNGGLAPAHSANLGRESPGRYTSGRAEAPNRQASGKAPPTATEQPLVQPPSTLPASPTGTEPPKTTVYLPDSTAQAGGPVPPTSAAEPPNVVAYGPSGPSWAQSGLTALYTNTTVERYPTVECPDQVVVEKEFAVQISLTEGLVTTSVVVTVGETNAAGQLVLQLPDQNSWKIDVIASAKGLTIRDGVNIGSIKLPRKGDSTSAVFYLRPNPIRGPQEQAKIYATLWHDGAYLARIERDVTVVNQSTASVVAAAERLVRSKSAQPAALPFGLVPPDLTVYVLERLGAIIIESPHLQPSVHFYTTPPDLSDWLKVQYAKFGNAAAQMDHQRPPFTNSWKEQTVPMLQGFGQELYRNYAPDAFKEAYWKLKKFLGTRFRSIEIFTDNPLLPWELMRPIGADNSEQDDFLGLGFRLARWHVSIVTDQLERPPSSLSMKELDVIAPKYRGTVVLPDTEKEIHELLSIQCAHRWPGNLEAVRTLFSKFPDGVIHFAGHGDVHEIRPGVFEYAMHLENSDLDLLTFHGMVSTRGGGHPLFFFNACQLGQCRQVANFVDGWAPAVLEAGASGYIGALWPVDDAGASQFAIRFYQKVEQGLTNGPVNVGDVLCDVRHDFYETGDPSFLAYVYYGDPNFQLLSPTQTTPR
jgi:hypothetical protein